MTASRRGIPLEKDISSRLFPWLLAVMVYLVGLAIFSAFAMAKISGQWNDSLGAHLTIQLPPAALAEESRPYDLAPLTSLMEATPGIAGFRILARDELDRLLEPWLEESASSLDLSLPDLVAVTLEPGIKFDGPAFSQEVGNILPDAIVTDHKAGLEGLADLADSVRLISTGVIILVALSATLMAILTTKMGLAAHAPVIELLHLMGAEDRFVAAQFQRHALIGGLMGGLIGLALSLSTIAVIARATFGLDHTLVPSLTLAAPQWALLFALPLASAAITTVTVRLTVLRSLARMP